MNQNADAHDSRNPYPTEPAVNAGPLPDPFALDDGGRVATAEQWRARRKQWLEMIVDVEYGGLPPAPLGVDVERLCCAVARRLEAKPRLWSFRLHCRGGERPFSTCIRILAPAVDEPVPAVIHGDGCWWYVSDEVAERVLDAGCALVMFNRTELAEDLGHENVPDKHKRSGGLYDVYPDRSFGALAAWAWGCHRVVDALTQLDFIDGARIAVTGHSRGGKAALLAGATDERIAITNDNASCAGGSAAFRYVGDGGETLNIVNVFPSWFGPKLAAYLNREQDLPFDQHCLIAAAAPRPLLLTYALDDRWSNPEGMVQAADAAREVYRFLGAGDKLAYHLRPGRHTHAVDDWRTLLDFLGVHWRGRQPNAAYNRHPYSHLTAAFAWRAPNS